jgi:hypothetical protein
MPVYGGGGGPGGSGVHAAPTRAPTAATITTSPNRRARRRCTTTQPRAATARRPAPVQVSADASVASGPLDGGAGGSGVDDAGAGAVVVGAGSVVGVGSDVVVSSIGSAASPPIVTNSRLLASPSATRTRTWEGSSTASGSVM